MESLCNSVEKMSIKSFKIYWLLKEARVARAIPMGHHVELEDGTKIKAVDVEEIKPTASFHCEMNFQNPPGWNMSTDQSVVKTPYKNASHVIPMISKWLKNSHGKHTKTMHELRNSLVDFVVSKTLNIIKKSAPIDVEHGYEFNYTRVVGIIRASYSHTIENLLSKHTLKKTNTMKKYITHQIRRFSGKADESVIGYNTLLERIEGIREKITNAWTDNLFKCLEDVMTKAQDMKYEDWIQECAQRMTRKTQRQLSLFDIFTINISNISSQSHEDWEEQWDNIIACYPKFFKELSTSARNSIMRSIVKSDIEDYEKMLWLEYSNDKTDTAFMKYIRSLTKPLAIMEKSCGADHWNTKLGTGHVSWEHIASADEEQFSMDTSLFDKLAIHYTWIACSFHFQKIFGNLRYNQDTP